VAAGTIKITIFASSLYNDTSTISLVRSSAI
jgi:hypothetical protein